MQQILIDDRYALGNLLGSGGMAEVYLAHDEVLDLLLQVVDPVPRAGGVGVLALRQLLLSLTIALVLGGAAPCRFGHPAGYGLWDFALSFIISDRFELR